MLGLLLALALGQYPQHRLFLQPNLQKSGNARPAFYLDPGALGPACACANISDASGVAITWTRAGSAYCTDVGLSKTGISNTSMVSCSSNLPRVESDGTALGVLSERAATNSCLQSEDFATTWGKSADVTRTVNQATAPNNTVTADALVFNDAAVSESAVFQGITRTAGAWVDSVYVKGNGQSGTIDLVQFNSSVNLFSAACAYNSTTWTRCSVGPNTLSALSWFFIIGCEKQGMTSNCTSSPSVYLWGAQAEAGDAQHTAYLSSYVPTTTAAASRVADTAMFDGSYLPGTSLSLTAYVTPAWVIGEQLSVTGVLEGQVGSASGAGFFYVASGQRLQTLNSGSANITTALAPAFARYVTHKVGATNIGGQSTNYEDGAVIGGPTATNTLAAPWSSTTGLGYAPSTAGSSFDGIISRLCVDSSTARCPQ